MNKIKIFLKGLFDTSEEDKMKDKILSENIDFGNIVSSSLLAKSLYDELKKVCHPDRFKNEHDNSKANELFQLITQYKGNYNELLSLKERVYNELHINNKNY